MIRKDVAKAEPPSQMRISVYTVSNVSHNTSTAPMRLVYEQVILYCIV
jgi:hypothetical protein